MDLDELSNVLPPTQGRPMELDELSSVQPPPPSSMDLFIMEGNDLPEMRLNTRVS